MLDGNSGGIARRVARILRIEQRPIPGHEKAGTIPHNIPQIWVGNYPVPPPCRLPENPQRICRHGTADMVRPTRLDAVARFVGRAVPADRFCGPADMVRPTDPPRRHCLVGRTVSADRHSPKAVPDAALAFPPPQSSG